MTCHLIGQQSRAYLQASGMEVGMESPLKHLEKEYMLAHEE